MGSFHFHDAPSFATSCAERHGGLERLVGTDRGWTMPVGIWSTPGGFDVVTAQDDLRHHTVTVPKGRAHVEATRWGPRVHSLPDPAGGFALQPEGVPSRYWCGSGVCFAQLYFREDFVRRIGVELFGAPGDRVGLLRDDLPFGSDSELRALTDDYLRRALQDLDVPTTLEMDSRANLIGLRLVRRYSILAPEAAVSARRGGLMPWQLRRVTEYLEEHVSRDVSLAELAGLVGLSLNHFCTAFRHSTGEPPHRYFINRRLDRAKGLLTDPGLSVTDVALAVGFRSSAHFSTTFRRMSGATPSDWRRDHPPANCDVAAMVGRKITKVATRT